MASNKSPLIIGNWKMYKTIPEAIDFVKGLLPKIEESGSQVYLAVPFTCIQPLAKEAEGSPLVIGAQNMNDASEGAFTGEIAARMLKDAGAKFVILGHSERRRLFHEDDAFINRKLKRAVQEGLQPILCVGESIQESPEKAIEFVTIQLNAGLEGIDPKNLSNLIIAYEPVWAIGTHISATPEKAQEMQQAIRKILSTILKPKIADKISIIYGGSVSPKNAPSFLQQQDINGLLVGGASLSLENFVEIIHTSEQLMKEA